jgi:hypothetical protein
MGDLRRPAALLLVRTLWVSSPTPGAATAQVLAAMRVSLARSFVADPSRIRHVERVGERVHVGVEQVPVNGQRERGRTVRHHRSARPSAMRRRFVYHHDRQVLKLGLFPCDRLRSLLGVAHSVERRESCETSLALLRGLS